LMEYDSPLLVYMVALPGTNHYEGRCGKCKYRGFESGASEVFCAFSGFALGMLRIIPLTPEQLGFLSPDWATNSLIEVI
jgi:hypothetical protein